MSIRWFDRTGLDREITKKILRVGVVLDIGCGIRPQQFFTPAIHICCEPHFEYVQILKQRFQDRNLIVLQSTWSDALSIMPDDSVDSIFLLDLIEHLDKTDGVALLAQCERVARRQIVLFTPLGFMPQAYSEGDIDGWGLHGSMWQVHKSGWEPQEFGPSWEIFAARHYHAVNGKGEPYNPPAGAFWAIKNLTGSGTQAGVRKRSHGIIDAGYDWADHITKRFVMLTRQLPPHRS